LRNPRRERRTRRRLDPGSGPGQALAAEFAAPLERGFTGNFSAAARTIPAPLGAAETVSPEPPAYRPRQPS
jgi:hypothetical protein